MDRKVGLALLAVLFLAAVALGVVAVGYNIGVSQGMMESGRVVAPSPGTPPLAYGAPYGFYRPFGFGFGIFGCIFPFLGILFFFFLLRTVFWGARGWGGGHWHGRRAEMFEQWHRDAHAAQSAAGTPGAAPGAPTSQPPRE